MNASSDSWPFFTTERSGRHRRTVTEVRAGQLDLSNPRYIGGEWNAPPEDCGGIHGFYEMLDIIADPDHNDVKEWLRTRVTFPVQFVSV